MPNVECAGCGREVSTRSIQCSNCGTPIGFAEGAPLPGKEARAGDDQGTGGPATRAKDRYDVQQPGGQGRPEFAGFGRRLAALTLDILAFLVMAVPYLVLIVLSETFGWNDPDVAAWVWLVCGVTLGGPLLGMGFYQIRLLTVSGQTVGKRLLGIRIVSADNLKREGFFRAFLLREVARLVLLFVPLGRLADVITMLVRDDRRTIHDLIAGTAVVKGVRET